MTSGKHLFSIIQATLVADCSIIFSVVPTRFFLAKPAINEEISISIETGKTLTIKLLAIGPLDQSKGTRECFFELNGETRAVVINDTNAAIEHVSREKASSDPGSVGSPMVSYLLLLTL